MAPHKKKNRYSHEASELVRVSRHDKWLKKSIKKHNDRFSYPNTLYEFDALKRGMVTIVCNLHDHSFTILPDNHKRFVDGGCEICFLERRRKRSIKKGEKKFIIYFQDNFIDRYEIYSEFRGLKKPINIFCKKHQSVKTITKAERILVSTYLCDHCYESVRTLQNRKTFDDLQSDLDGRLPDHIHLVDLIFDEKKNRSMVLFNCDIHGDQPPVNLGYINRTIHYCTKCGDLVSGFSGHRFKYLLDNNLRGESYIIGVIEVEVFGIRGMKVGVTSQRRGLKNRYSFFIKQIFFSVVLDEIDILALENRIKIEFDKYRDKSIMGKGVNQGERWAGDTEIFYFHQKENIINFIKDSVDELHHSDINYHDELDSWYMPESFPVNVSREKNLNNIPIPVIGVDMNTNEIICEFESIAASNRAGYKNVSLILSGERIHSNGIRFFKKEGFDPENIPSIS